MAIRFRVYPSYASAGMMNGPMGGNVMQLQNRFMQTQLNNQKQLSSLQLKYERALWGERLDKVRLEERLKNPYARMGGMGGFGGFGGNPFMMGGIMPGAWGAAMGINPGISSGFWGSVGSWLR